MIELDGSRYTKSSVHSTQVYAGNSVNENSLKREPSSIAIYVTSETNAEPVTFIASN